jgi:hypothetical protein
VKADTSAHLIDTETLTGYSTRPRLNGAEDYDVSYERMELIGDGSWIADVGEAINVTRAYTNPMNGEQSLAFCNRITVRDEENSGKKQAWLLRVVPTSNLEEKWVFPKEEFGDEDFSIIDTDGNYVIRGRSFKSNNFFEFYKSYNQPGITVQQQLFEEILSGTGSFTMQDSKDRECIVAFTPVTSTKGWVLLSSAPVSDLSSATEDWLLIGVISFGLLLLLVIRRGETSKPVSGPVAVVTLNGEEAGRYPLSEEGSFSLNGGSNLLIVSGGEAWVSEADCPDKVCMGMGKISRPGEFIACLPNRLIITVEDSGGASGPDAVT